MKAKIIHAMKVENGRVFPIAQIGKRTFRPIYTYENWAPGQTLNVVKFPEGYFVCHPM